jgi:hypothetical protein
MESGKYVQGDVFPTSPLTGKKTPKTETRPAIIGKKIDATYNIFSQTERDPGVPPLMKFA